MRYNQIIGIYSSSPQDRYPWLPHYSNGVTIITIFSWYCSNDTDWVETGRDLRPEPDLDLRPYD